MPIVHFERLGHLLHDEMSAGTGVQLLQGSHQRDDTAGSGQLSREIPQRMVPAQHHEDIDATTRRGSVLNDYDHKCFRTSSGGASIAFDERRPIPYS